MPDFSLENTVIDEGYAIVCGVDEAGRGPWAGPVVAGAAILDMASLPEALKYGLDDSKKLTGAKRETLFGLLEQHARTGVGIASVDEIDTVNILQATMLAMGRAVSDLSRAGLGIVPDMALVDGNREPALDCPARAIVKGDGRSLSIAAASIVAKVTRDRMMAELALAHPQYGWQNNAGYGTAQHRAALDEFGVTPHHRRSFKPIARILRSTS
ncbi:MAG: ribonuclease HII [Rhodospirillaceae bacterium]|jgi:ribonuclease HII|nr:ribonuclease HII [Rhodospirillaceae bacterium]MBT5307840.1 ribonuclease HII [Rhodospirillaceae bacterium]MBT6406509.1 ribonuclease HII [Rhodospirillaceae bacterium]MBT7355400.1 ribonuclease HII [Rhodospirillaceae bacterium]